MGTALQSVAAVQIDAKIGDIPYNISQAGDLAEKALKAGAKIVALPEFFTTKLVLDNRLFKSSLRRENNPALSMMKELALRYEATIGGSYLEYEEDTADVYNTYILVEPNGTVHRHRKDLPTMVENAFYVGGSDTGLLKTSEMSLGAAVCWETIRSTTIERLRGKCDLLMTGSHWWCEPGWAFSRRFWHKLARSNADHMYRAPGRFAKLVGAPNLHAAHAGKLDGEFALTVNKSVRFKSRLLGETQITNANGDLLARRQGHEGAGVIHAKIAIGRTAPEKQIKQYWLEDLPLTVRLTWWQQNWVGKKIYARAKKDGKIKPFDHTLNFHE